ncbi:MAG TPA: hypothetical protein VFN90_10415, partial [Gemmatimonadales bacterium]|nr:hypothetical protein [Gemmatimonadales bacterium]
MPARATRLTVWSDLEAAGGVQLAPLRRARQWQTTYRVDGDDRLSGEWPLELHRAAGITIGHVLRVERADSTIEEWIVEKVDRDPVKNTLAITALPRLAWFGERVLVRDGMDVELTLSGTLSQVLTALFATDEWPSWCVAGTLDRDPVISVTVNAVNGRDALRAILAAANAADEVALQGETMRLEIRRVSASQLALDWLTTPPSGVVVLEEGKNIDTPRESLDRVPQVQAVLPIGAGGAGIAAAYALVRNIGGSGANRLELRDWSFRADRLWVAYDGQWVGGYVIAPNGTAVQIVDSFAETQEVELTSVAAFGTDDIVRLASDNTGTAFTEVAVAGATNPRRVVEVGDWTDNINWARNAQWFDWSGGGGTKPRDWTDSITGWTLSRETGASFRETGRYSLKIVTDATATDRFFTMNAFGWPSAIRSPGGGTQTWRYGVRVYIAGTGTLTMQATNTAGASWGAITATGTNQ